MSEATAQTPDKNINNLCGCFNVEFKYAETFHLMKNYIFTTAKEFAESKILPAALDVRIQTYIV